MKIIEDNYNYVQFTRTIRCELWIDNSGSTYHSSNEYCESVLKIDATDVKKHNWANFDEKGTSYVVVCPLCGCWIELDPDTLPRAVKENAEPIQRGRRSNEEI